MINASLYVISEFLSFALFLFLFQVQFLRVPAEEAPWKRGFAAIDDPFVLFPQSS